MIPKFIDSEMFFRFVVAIIIGFSLIVTGIVVYFTQGLIGLLIVTFGLGALTFALGITNTMVRVEEYFNNKEIHMKFPNQDFKCEYCGKSFGEEPLVVGEHIVKEHPEKLGDQN